MHEFNLINNLLRKAETVALNNQAHRITRVTVRLGSQAHISEAHFRDHFSLASQGTMAEGAELVIETSQDFDDPNAQDILLKIVDVDD
jgi:hydrogenase nickel incorporation protein HypA/HybF